MKTHKTSLIKVAAMMLSGMLAYLLISQASMAGGEVLNALVSKPLPGNYIVVFSRKIVEPMQEAKAIANAHGGRVLATYRNALRGATIKVPQERAAALEAALRNNPNVTSFEVDATVHIAGIQSGPTWGLDRLDQRDLPISGSYTYETAASGLPVFIIDTGIRGSHQDFSGRVIGGAYFIQDGRGTSDCNGHGTHVAGTVGGTTYGVAKGVTLIPVRVLDCAGSGTTTGVIAGIDYVTGTTLRPAVANMSLGGGKSTALNAAVAGAVNSGVTMVVAAGNNNRDACNYSPASEPTAITVGATTSSDYRASYSNYGKCLDVFAPGSSITSAWMDSDRSIKTISGTSMAAPHVAGIAALIIASGRGMSPDQILQQLIANATPGKVSSAGTGSPNLLSHSLFPSSSGGGGSGSGSTSSMVSVSSITGSAQAVNAKNWIASARVAINTQVQNATVYGSFSNGGGSKSCTITNASSCSMVSSNLSRSSVKSLTFTVTGISGDNIVYDSNSNVITSIMIARP